MADIETPPETEHQGYAPSPSLGPEGGAVHTLEHVDQYLHIGRNPTPPTFISA